MMNEDGWITKYGENQCGNCHAGLEEGDKYCRMCGTKRGEGEFKPYRNVMECIYGPMPEKRKHVCTQCHYTWTTEVMLDEEYYCPKCGGDAPYEGSEDDIFYQNKKKTPYRAIE